MKPESQKPIPIPLSQRWNYVRMSLLPLLVFGGALVLLAVLWKSHVAAPNMVGQVESVTANVSSHLTGVIAVLNVQRFQHVKAGDLLGQVITADPKLLEASLAAVRSEVDLLRANLEPISLQQRNALDYAQTRLNWMRQRAALAGDRAELQGAEADFRRAQELFDKKIAPEAELDLARAHRDALKGQVAELTQLVTEIEGSFKELELTNVPPMSRISEEPLRAAIAAQEAQLHLIEAQLAPVILRAPTDGIVSAVFFRSGEAVVSGAPIVTISSPVSTRIIGYMRPPLIDEPAKGMKVEVRTRGLRRQVATAEVVDVGVQLEPLPLVLQSPMKPLGSELGLTVEISLPSALRVMPGELVDVRLLSSGN